MTEKLGPRREPSEVKLPGHKQRRSWQRWTQHAQEEIAYDIDSLGLLADLISTSGLRAFEAGKLKDKAWESKLHDIKHYLLIRAAQMRKAGADIQIGRYTYLDNQLQRHESILFVIGTKSNPFVAKTDFEKLSTVMEPNSLCELIEPYDQLDPAIQIQCFKKHKYRMPSRQLVEAYDQPYPTIQTKNGVTEVGMNRIRLASWSRRAS